MNPVHFIVRYRTQIFIILVFLEVIFSFGAYSYRAATTKIFFFCETLVTLAIIILSFILLDKFNFTKYLMDKKDTVLQSAPVNHLYYDFNTEAVYISSAAISILNIARKKKYTIADMASFFSNEQWRQIDKMLKKPASHINIERSGEININDSDGYPVFIRYHAQILRERELGVNILLIWLYDITETKMIQEESLGYLSKYREIAFLQNVMLESLQTPLCYTHNFNNHFIFNSLFSDMLDVVDNSEREIRKAVESLRDGQTIKSKTLGKHFHVSIIDDEKNKLGKLIIAHDNNIEYLLKKEISDLKNVFDSLVELSNNAVMLMNNDMAITNYNNKLVEIYNLDRKWLDERPTFPEFLDMLQQKNAIPESIDFINYKKEMLQSVLNNKPYTNFVHKHADEILKISVLSCKGGASIYVCENISDILSVERSYNELYMVLKDMVTYFDAAVMIVGFDGKIRNYNQKLIKLFNVDEGDVQELESHYSNFIKRVFGEQESTDSVMSDINFALEVRQNKVLTTKALNGEMITIKIRCLSDNSVLVSFINE